MLFTIKQRVSDLLSSPTLPRIKAVVEPLSAKGTVTTVWCVLYRVKSMYRIIVLRREQKYALLSTTTIYFLVLDRDF